MSNSVLTFAVHQVEVIKRAAEIMGIPYQTYLKQVVFRQAIADINAAKEAEAV